MNRKNESKSEIDANFWNACNFRSDFFSFSINVASCPLPTHQITSSETENLLSDMYEWDKVIL